VDHRHVPVSAAALALEGVDGKHPADQVTPRHAVGTEDAPVELQSEALQVRVLGRLDRNEGKHIGGGSTHEDTVRHEDVQLNVEPGRVAEALHEDHCTRVRESAWA